MTKDSWYNGYSWKERNEKLQVLKRLVASGKLPLPAGRCDLCGDPEPEGGLEYHDEDYSKPYLWDRPALFTLCRNCHRFKLHRRFLDPPYWHAFLAHVRRGGYARELKSPEIRKEFREFRSNTGRSSGAPLRQLRPYDKVIGSEWFAKLRTDPASLRDPASRPRP